MTDMLATKVPRAELLEDLKSFGRKLAMATGERVELDIKVDARSWVSVRSHFQRPYKQKPSAEFALFEDFGCITIRRDPPEAEETAPALVGPLPEGLVERGEDHEGWKQMVRSTGWSHK